MALPAPNMGTETWTGAGLPESPCPGTMPQAQFGPVGQRQHVGCRSVPLTLGQGPISMGEC